MKNILKNSKLKVGALIAISWLQAYVYHSSFFCDEKVMQRRCSQSNNIKSQMFFVILGMVMEVKTFLTL